MQDEQRQIKEIEVNGKLAKGRRHLLAKLKGEKITRGEAITAKCYDCMGYYVDGIKDCGITTCPLYVYMPYKGKNV